MQDERLRVLQLLSDGKVSIEQANELIEALDRTEKAEPAQTKQPSSGEKMAGLNRSDLGHTLANIVGKTMSKVFSGVMREGGRTNFGAINLTQESLECMEDGTNFTNFGSMTISGDISAELLEQKITSIVNFGAVNGPKELVSILESRCESNFGAFSSDSAEVEDKSDADISNLGRTVLTREQLENMPDGVKYSNLGRLTIADDVTEELLKQKIAVYENLGRTSGPRRLLGVLQARCSENLGRFATDETEE